MNYPLIIITGEAGSGKDTIGAFLAKAGKGVCIAQADPMKRLAKHLFGFNDEQLWGPSAMRNAADQLWTPERIRSILVNGSINLSSAHTTDWLTEVLNTGGQKVIAAGADLERWFQDTLVECSKRGAVTPRHVLQTLGTEWGRNFSKNIWVDYAARTAQKLLGGGYVYDRAKGLRYQAKDEEGQDPALVVITDGRFRNEVLAVKALGGQAWRVDPSGDVSRDKAAVATSGVAGHKSETEQRGIPDWYFDIIYFNDKSLGLNVAEFAVADILQDDVNLYNRFTPLARGQGDNDTHFRCAKKLGL